MAQSADSLHRVGAEQAPRVGRVWSKPKWWTSRRGQAIAIAGGLSALAAAVLIRDPHVPGSMGVCPSVVLFGVYCPGCGSLRGTYDLLQGDVAAAAGHNVLLIPALMFVVGWILWQFRPTRPPTISPAGATAVQPRLSRAVPVLLLYGALVAVLVVFTVLRNLPGSPLAP